MCMSLKRERPTRRDNGYFFGKANTQEFRHTGVKELRQMVLSIAPLFVTKTPPHITEN